MHVGLGKLRPFSSTQEAWSTGLVRLLGGWLPQKRIGSRKECVALLQTIVQGELKSPEECAGLPRLGILRTGTYYGLYVP